jgi:hypothetical protein
MEREIPDTQVAPIAYVCCNFFEYVSDYFDALDHKTVILRGKRYRRIRYGDGREYWETSAKEVAEYKASASTRPCHDCGVIKGLSARIWKNVHLSRVLENEELTPNCAQGRHSS